MRGGGTSRVGLRSAAASWEWPIPTRSDDSPRMPAPTGKAGDSVAFAPTGPTRRHRGLQDAESFGSRYRGPTPSSQSHRVDDKRPSEVREPMLGLGNGFVGQLNPNASADQARRFGVVQAAMPQNRMSRRSGVVSGAPQNSGTSPFNQWLAGIRKPPGPRAHALSPLR